MRYAGVHLYFSVSRMSLANGKSNLPSLSTLVYMVLGISRKPFCIPSEIWIVNIAYNTNSHAFSISFTENLSNFDGFPHLHPCTITITTAGTTKATTAIMSLKYYLRLCSLCVFGGRCAVAGRYRRSTETFIVIWIILLLHARRPCPFYPFSIIVIIIVIFDFDEHVFRLAEIPIPAPTSVQDENHMAETMVKSMLIHLCTREKKTKDVNGFDADIGHAERPQRPNTKYCAAHSNQIEHIVYI